MKQLLSYRSVIILCTFLTGMTGLIFQVVWQKYLSYLVGSEARSMSLVVAVFLLGLASGYRFWGRVSEKIKERRRLLKIYGYVELGIGAYAIIFPVYYRILEGIAYQGANSIAFDFLIAVLAIFVPTFLMGATIPLLTSVVPQNANDVNSTHAQIYGINTLGAVLGAFGGGFIVLPALGLVLSLFVGGMLNILVGILLGFNRLEGSSQEKGEITSITNRFGTPAIYALVFVTGCISISYELLFVRIMNLTVGSAFYVFPMVVGVFVLGLALGSLSLYRKPITLGRLFKEMIFLLAYLCILYWLIPYWPAWLQNVRASLTSVPSNYGVYLILVSLFLAVMSLPFLIPMGRLLPVGYSLISKDKDNYGNVCGHIYFINSLGTLLGSLFLGHYIMYWFDVDQIFKLILVLFAAMTLWLLYREKQKNSLLITATLLLIVLILPPWNRYNQQVGLFRDQHPTNYSFKGLFHIANAENKKNILFFNDGPNTSVTVMEAEPMGDDIALGIRARSLFVNGKSDGSTYGDHSTITLVATIPYMHAKPEKDLSAVVIGLGTGVTAGMLASAQDVSHLTVLEISSTVLDTMKMFDIYTNNLSTNPKVEFVESDAFRYFARTDKKYDLIISEPSNPWVMGVENLFTPAFYEKTKRAMTADGVFMQWCHIYGMDEAVLSSVIKNISSQFKYLQFYIIGSGDVGIAASMVPFTTEHLDKRWNEELIRKFHKVAGVLEKQQIDLLKLYGEKELNFIGSTKGIYNHDIDMPRLSYVAHQSLFMDPKLDLNALLLPGFARILRDTSDASLIKAVSELATKYKSYDAIPFCQEPVDVRRRYMCERLELVKNYLEWIHADKTKLSYATLSKYRELRQKGVIAADLGFLYQQAKAIPVNSKVESRAALLLTQEFSKEKEWEEGGKVIERLVANQTLSPETAKQFYYNLDDSKRNATQVIQNFILPPPQSH